MTEKMSLEHDYLIVITVSLRRKDLVINVFKDQTNAPGDIG